MFELGLLDHVAGPKHGRSEFIGREASSVILLNRFVPSLFTVACISGRNPTAASSNDLKFKSVVKYSVKVKELQSHRYAGFQQALTVELRKLRIGDLTL
jgi:hypothetical protein